LIENYTDRYAVDTVQMVCTIIANKSVGVDAFSVSTKPLSRYLEKNNISKDSLSQEQMWAYLHAAELKQNRHPNSRFAHLRALIVYPKSCLLSREALLFVANRATLIA
jgi:hypothetical protein